MHYRFLPALIFKIGLVAVYRVFVYRFLLAIGYYRIRLPIKSFNEPDFEILSADKSVIRSNVSQSEHLVALASETLRGRFRLFSHFTYDARELPNWHLDPIRDSVFSKTGHWSCVINPPGADVKHVWEMSRFFWAPQLAAAWRVTGDRQYVSFLNKLITSWLKENSWNEGVNWQCGQETSIRMLNLLLAWWFLGEEKSLSLIDVILRHVERIKPTINYAIGQDNNHGTSEAAALYIGGRWLEVNSESNQQRTLGKDYAKLGRKILEDRVQKLVFPDGGFSQFSTNYHRLLIDTLSIVEFWRTYFSDQSFTIGYRKKWELAISWLSALVEQTTGRVPNLGANDSSYLFCWAGGDFRDFRPSLQLASRLATNKQTFPNADHLADLMSINQTMPAVELPKASRVFVNFGLVVMRYGDWNVFLKIASDYFRPSQADCLHLDLFYKGRSILCDAGTYSYSDDLHKFFSGTAAHNTVIFDDRDQMPRFSKFLFSSWLKMKNTSEVFLNETGCWWSGSYLDHWGMEHTRTILINSDEVIVDDEIKGNYEKAKLNWRLSGNDWEQTAIGLASRNIQISLDVEGSKMGKTLTSHYYSEKHYEPLLFVEFEKPKKTVRTRINLLK